MPIVDKVVLSFHELQAVQLIRNTGPIISEVIGPKKRLHFGGHWSTFHKNCISYGCTIYSTWSYDYSLRHHQKDFQRKTFSRAELFGGSEKPVLNPLPESSFVMKHYIRAKVQRDYHVVLGEDWHFYRVRSKHIGSTVNIIYCTDTVEIYIGSNCYGGGQVYYWGGGGGGGGSAGGNGGVLIVKCGDIVTMPNVNVNPGKGGKGGIGGRSIRCSYHGQEGTSGDDGEQGYVDWQSTGGGN